MKTLNDLFIHELQDLWSAEQSMTEGLETLKGAAADSEISAAIAIYWELCQGRMPFLAGVIEEKGHQKNGKPCKALAALVHADEMLVDTTASSFVKDAALLGALHRICHYKMAAYGCAASYAEQVATARQCNWLRSALLAEERADSRFVALGRRLTASPAPAAGGPVSPELPHQTRRA